MTPKTFNTAIGKAIRELRLKHGFNQKILGDAIDVTYQQICKFEHGINALSAFQISKLADLLGVTVADLYVSAGVSTAIAEPSPAENDSFMAARYVRKITDPNVRSVIIDVARKAAYKSVEAA